MSDYSQIEQLRSKQEFLRVEITPHTEDGEHGEGVDPKINRGYLVKGAVIVGMGVASPVLEHVGISPLAVLSAQTLLIGFMVGQLSQRAVSNSRLDALEGAYILEHGTHDEKEKLRDNIENNQNYRPLKRAFLTASAVLAGSMTVMEMANSGSSTLASNLVSVGAGIAGISAGVLHFYDKMASNDRGRLAHAIAQRRNETQTPPPGSPLAKTSL